MIACEGTSSDRIWIFLTSSLETLAKILNTCTVHTHLLNCAEYSYGRPNWLAVKYYRFGAVSPPGQNAGQGREPVEGMLPKGIRTMNGEGTGRSRSNRALGRCALVRTVGTAQVLYSTVHLCGDVSFSRQRAPALPTRTTVRISLFVPHRILGEVPARPTLPA